MRVFISWSGERGKLIGASFRTWLPDVIQAVEPFFSPDIEKGERWTVEIARGLRECKAGIICVTPESMESPWLAFESGAISNAELAKVCPLLFELDPGQLRGPLNQFQATPYSQDEVRLLVTAINNLLPTPLPDAQLSRNFERCWPELEAAIGSALAASDVRKPAKRSVEEMLEETLTTVRGLANARSEEPNLSEDSINHWVVVFRGVMDFGAQIEAILAKGSKDDEKLLDALTSTINHLRLMLNLAQPKLEKGTRYKQLMAEANALLKKLDGAKTLYELF